ncbi:MAG: hypothetical protein K2P87_00320, partial [Lachnospiraceae bacterium]|nr:hypothetical protein [Lachnospiraceae bacterium]
MQMRKNGNAPAAGTSPVRKHSPGQSFIELLIPLCKNTPFFALPRLTKYFGLPRLNAVRLPVIIIEDLGC